MRGSAFALVTRGPSARPSIRRSPHPPIAASSSYWVITLRAMSTHILGTRMGLLASIQLPPSSLAVVPGQTVQSPHELQRAIERAKSFHKNRNAGRPRKCCGSGRCGETGWPVSGCARARSRCLLICAPSRRRPLRTACRTHGRPPPGSRPASRPAASRPSACSGRSASPARAPKQRHRDRRASDR